MAEDDAEATMVRGPLAATLPDPIVHALVITDEAGSMRRAAIVAPSLTIGRGSDNGLILPTLDVSRHHARILLRNDSARIEDLGSTNGTWLDGKRVAGETPLLPGARFSIGSFALHYQCGPAREMARAAELEAELERAFRYTQALLPAPISEGPVRAEWCFQPSARIGGDALGYRFLDSTRFAAFMIDVAGHGVGSALLAASVMNALRERAGADPAAVLASLNASFQMEEQGGQFFTMWYGVADVAARRLDFACAGHHPGFLLHRGTAAPEPVGTRNPPIGMLPDVRFRTGRTALSPGCRLLLISDGAFETRTPDGQQRGLADLLPLIAGPPEPGPGTAERLMRALRDAARPRLLDDDASILSLEFP
jgi:sigma-B regulation protein RsbU (phosphoserine phosphatase)